MPVAAQDLWSLALDHLQLYERLGFQRIGGDEVQHYMERRAQVR